MLSASKIAPCLWLDSQAEEAARHYTRIFKNSRIVRTARYTKAGFEFHHKPEGSVLTVEFEIEGQTFVALNGGPAFKFTEAISFQVFCANQEEIDYYWNALTEGGDANTQQCGWLKDRFGVSWQIVPAILPGLLADPAKSERAMQAVLGMKKIDIAAIERAVAA